MIDLNQKLKIEIKNEKHCRAVLLRLFEIGITWITGETYLDHLDAITVFIGEDTPRILTVKLPDRRRSPENPQGHKTITLDDLYDEEKPALFSVNLTSPHGGEPFTYKFTERQMLEVVKYWYEELSDYPFYNRNTLNIGQYVNSQLKK